MKTTLPHGATPAPEPPPTPGTMSAADGGGALVLPDQISPFLENTLQCVVDRLDPVPGRIFVAPGATVAWDDCCEDGGQVWTRLVNVGPVLQGVGQTATRGRGVGCLILGWSMLVEVGIVRCAATVNSEGQPPTAEAITADAYQQVLDVQAVMSALECCIEPFNLPQVAYTPAGPQGGCVGGTWQFTQRLATCGCG